jgi:hypothetical protein
MFHPHIAPAWTAWADFALAESPAYIVNEFTNWPESVQASGLFHRANDQPHRELSNVCFEPAPPLFE